MLKHQILKYCLRNFFILFIVISRQFGRLISSTFTAHTVQRSSDMCPESYHWQAVLRIFSFSPSDVNMSRREISLTALLQKPQSCFKVAAVFTFVLQLAAVPAVVLPGSWMVFISHLKPERQDTSCALQPATTRTLSSYFYADKTRRHSEIFC